MKIKTDFITNSSSIAYIVMVPNNFYFGEDEIQKSFNDRILDFDYPPVPTEKKTLEEFSECIEILKEGDNLWHYGNQGVSQLIYYMVTDLCDEHGFVLTSFDINGEGSNIIQGVPEETIEKMMANNIDIMSIFKLIQRENESDTSKTK